MTRVTPVSGIVVVNTLEAIMRAGIPRQDVIRRIGALYSIDTDFLTPDARTILNSFRNSQHSLIKEALAARKKEDNRAVV